MAPSAGHHSLGQSSPIWSTWSACPSSTPGRTSRALKGEGRTANTLTLPLRQGVHAAEPNGAGTGTWSPGINSSARWSGFLRGSGVGTWGQEPSGHPGWPCWPREGKDLFRVSQQGYKWVRKEGELRAQRGCRHRLSPPARSLHSTDDNPECQPTGVAAQPAEKQPPTHRAPEDELYPSPCRQELPRGRGGLGATV